MNPSKNLPQIFVVEDDELFQRSLERLLTVCNYKSQCFRSAESFLDFLGLNIHNDQNSILIMDVNLNGISGIEAQESIKKKAPDIPYIFISAQHDARCVYKAWRGGAKNFLFKPFKPEQLIEAIQEVSLLFQMKPTKEEVVPDFPVTADTLPDTELLTQIKQLTPRQKQVCKLVANGYSNTEIATMIHLSARTVKMHRASIMHRLGFTHVVDLIRFHDACAHLLD